MAGNNIKGITVEINGDTGPLNTALKSVNKTSSDLQSQLKQVNYQLKFDPKNTILLQQKQELLAKSITNTKDKLVTLKTAEEQAQAKFAEGKISEEQYQALQREVIKTSDQLKKLELQAAKSNSTLNKVSEASDKIAKGSAKVGQTMAPVTLAITALGGAAVKMGSDYIESLNKVNVAFGSSAKGVENFSKTTLDSFGIASGTALDMASNFGDMATSMGLPQAAAAAMSEKLVGLGGDLASFKNISIDEANTALDSVFTGETESLKKLGIVMTQQNLQEFAASKGIKTKIADMTQQQQVQLRYNYVMEKTKNAQGDFARTSDGAANSTRIATQSIKEAGESIGVLLAPMLAKAAQYVANLAKSFAGLSDGTKQTILIILAVIAAVGPLAFLISSIATVVGAVTGAITLVSGAIGVATMGAAAATPAIAALGAVIGFIISPVGLTIIAIVALVAGFALLWTHCEGFRAFWIGLWDGIKSTTKIVVDTLVGFFTVTIPSAWNSLKTFFTGIPAWFSGIWTSVKTSTESIWNGIKIFFSNIWNEIKAVIMVAVTPLINGVMSIFRTLSPGLTTIFNGIKAFFTGVWSAIKLIFLGPILLICDLVTGNFTKLKSDATNIFNGLKTAFSTIWNGIKGIFTGVVQAISAFLSLEWSGIVNIATSVFNGLKSFFIGLWNGIKSTAVGAWNGLKSSVISIISSIVSGSISTFNGILNFFRGLPGTLRSLGSNMINGLKGGISSVMGTIVGVIKNGFSSGISYLRSLPSQALGWGRDIINGIVNGIRSAAGAVGAAVSGVAQNIRSFLHFSVPDQGPLVDFESWMPDFMNGLANGIKNSKNLVTDAVKGLSTDMTLGMNLTPAIAGIGNIANSTNKGNQQNSLNINIDHFENTRAQDVQALAQELEFYRKQLSTGTGGK